MGVCRKLRMLRPNDQKSESLFGGGSAIFCKACGPYDGILACGATLLSLGSVLCTKHYVQTRLKKIALIPRGQEARKKDEAMPGGQWSVMIQ